MYERVCVGGTRRPCSGVVGSSLTGDEGREREREMLGWAWSSSGSLGSAERWQKWRWQFGLEGWNPDTSACNKETTPTSTHIQHQGAHSQNNSVPLLGFESHGFGEPENLRTEIRSEWIEVLTQNCRVLNLSGGVLAAHSQYINVSFCECGTAPERVRHHSHHDPTRS